MNVYTLYNLLMTSDQPYSDDDPDVSSSKVGGSKESYHQPSAIASQGIHVLTSSI